MSISCVHPTTSHSFDRMPHSFSVSHHIPNGASMFGSNVFHFEVRARDIRKENVGPHILNLTRGWGISRTPIPTGGLSSLLDRQSKSEHVYVMHLCIER